MATFSKRDGRIRVQVRRKGFPTRSATFTTMAEAKRWAEQPISLAARREIKAEQKGPVLSDALYRYACEISPTKKGEHSELNLINKWQRDPLAQERMHSISATEIVRWRDKKVKEGYAPSTIRNSLYLISHLYRIAITEWGYTGLQNPVRGVRMPRQGDGRDRRLLPGELPRLLQRASRYEGLPELIILAVETGMRQGELMSLKREDIRGRIACLKDTKNSRPREVPLSSRAMDALASLPSEGKLFLFTQYALWSMWRKVCKKAEIEDLRFHDLRHEAISRLFERGLSTEQVMKISGHTTYSMVARYTHLKADDLVRLLG